MESQQGRYEGAHKVTMQHEQALYLLPAEQINTPEPLSMTSLVSIHNQMHRGPDVLPMSSASVR